MNQKAMDSEVLRIIINVLKEQTKDNECDDRWREDAQFYLNLIGEAFIDVSSWPPSTVEKKQYEFGTSDLSLDDVIDEALDSAGFEKKDE
jgi:hypothetical protein